MSLRTGAELITLSLLLNKVSGIYGLLALLTGFAISPLQLSMYIYSVFALVLTAYLANYIRKQSPFHCLALAWFYIIDSIINAGYTVAFAMTWFLVVHQHFSGDGAGVVAGPGSAGKMIDDTAGFTSPEHNVSHVDIVATPAQGLTTGQDAVAVGIPGVPAAAGGPGLGNAMLQPESIPSIIVICFLWAVRLYFIFVMMAYARAVLRQRLSESNDPHFSGSPKASISPPSPSVDLFDRTTREGQGWRGRLGRIMVAVGRSYWLGRDAGDGDESWAMGVGGKINRKDASDVGDGVVERERRRRSGTDPPIPTRLQVPRWKAGLQ